MECKVYRVRIEEIISKDRYSPTFCPKLEGLSASIKEIGQIAPVILREGSNGWEVVCGLKRVMVLERMNSEVKAILFSNKELPPDKAVRISIGHNVWNKMNIIEKSHAVLKLEKEGVSINEIVKLWLPLLGMGPRREVFEVLKNIARLPHDLKTYIAYKDLSFSSAAYFTYFKDEELNDLTQLLFHLKLSENKIKEILEFIQYICLKEGIEVSTLINESKHIWEAPFLTPTERTEKFREWLRKRRYPYFQSIQNKFREITSRLGLSPEILKPPLFFEGEEYTVSFQFKNRDEFLKFVKMLETAAKNLAELPGDPFKELV